MVKLVVFDLDGTLLDTAYSLYLALRDALKDFGVEEPPFEVFKKHIGGGAYGFIAPFLPPEYHEEALMKLRHYYLTRYIDHPSARPFPGIVETLERLKEMGLHLAVATNKITEGAVRVLERKGLLNFFDVVAGRDLPKEHKPSPEHLFYILSALGGDLKPQNTLMVGDRSDDVECALKSGAYAGYALWGYNEDQLNVKPHFFIKTPIELPFLVANIARSV